MFRAEFQFWRKETNSKIRSQKYRQQVRPLSKYKNQIKGFLEVFLNKQLVEKYIESESQNKSFYNICLNEVLKNALLES